MIETCDFLVVGAGIAGASVAYELVPHGRVILLERETLPGYHATGRSAAIFLETYGNAVVRGLTRGSRDFLLSPPDGFSEVPLTRGRGALFIADRDSLSDLEQHYAAVSQLVTTAQWLDGNALRNLVPSLRDGWVAGVYEQEALDLDVHALHQGFLRGFKSSGGTLHTNEEVQFADYVGDAWRVETRQAKYAARVMVNAGGAWGDDIAQRCGVQPLGLSCLRRTAVTVDLPNPGATRWPYVGDIAETFYFKPEAGSLLATPCDENPIVPCDVQPDEIDVAMTAHRLEEAMTVSITHIRNRWAGLRTFSSDRTPVAGFDPLAKNFFWLVGQGGYGIQTSPAMAGLARSLIVSGRPPTELLALGVTAEHLSPGRFRRDQISIESFKNGSNNMSKTAILTENAPMPIGTYSQAIKAGSLIFMSAQAPINPKSMKVVEGGVEAQLQQAFRNLAAVAAEAGASVESIAKLTVYLTDLGNFPVLNKVMEEFFTKPFPARAVIGAVALPANADVAIEAIIAL